ncbi:MAG: GAF domain-containing protein [Opitutaceae bacterium]
MKAPLPAGETQRLAALRAYEVLDTAPEEAFDDLTLLAAHICQVPTAMVSLVDGNRQWFKSRIGLESAETSRDIAFCAHTILHADQVFEVRDAELDPRFAANPLVTSDLKIRFYAGAPLVTPDGHALGALCVMDRQPRALSPEQLTALRALSRRVVAQLELNRHARQLLAKERETSRLFAAADNSRRALLSLLEDQKQVETALRSSEERFRQIAENIHEVFWMTDLARNEMLYVSPAYEKIWGRSCESLRSAPSSWSDSIHALDRERVVRAVRTRQTSGDYDETYRILRPDGGLRWVRDRAFPIKNTDGPVQRVVGVAEDITQRKSGELRVELQHAVTKILAEAASLPQTARQLLAAVCRLMEWEVGGFWMIDRSADVLHCIEICHPALEEYRGFAEVARTSRFKVGEGLPGRVWEAMQTAWVPDVAQDSDFKRAASAALIPLRGAVGFPIQLHGQVLGVVEFFSQESRKPEPEVLTLFAAFGTQLGQFIERQQLAEQFRQAQKMEAIGTLAGGIAHDFNNVLAAIGGYTELAKWETAENPVVTEYLGAVLQGTRRATDLVRQILSFSRRQEIQRKPLKLRVVLDEALQLLRATIPTTVEFVLSPAPDTPNVMADATQVHQVVMNLCTNAAHAMKDGPGRLTIKLEKFQLDAAAVSSLAGLRRGTYVRLSIGDNGHGMDPATQSRIFEPFFTTKPPGEGTGLGLAVVHGIMQSHEGAVSVESRVGEGTTFHLYFPAHVAADLVSTPKIAEIPRGTGQKILLVDDEAPLANMGKRILERLGYQVDSYTNPREALLALHAQPGAYDLVITDYMMPALTGTALAEQIHALRPDLPIILTTGYSATLNAEKVEAMGISKLLLKPVVVGALGAAVFHLLNPTSKG